MGCGTESPVAGGSPYGSGPAVRLWDTSEIFVAKYDLGVGLRRGLRESITHFLFHSRLKTHLFYKSFSP